MSARVRRAAAAAGRREPNWPAAVAVVGAIALQLTLPERLVAGPRLVLPILEGALLAALLITTPHRHHQEMRAVRVSSLVLIGLVNTANVISLALLAHFLLSGQQATGRELILASFQVWLTNVLIFGLWYWELDRGGPGARTHPRRRRPDFLFPQMSAPEATMVEDWMPSFVDYLYVSLTNATAFSPTDTMPLTPWVKALMGVQSLASLLTVALVAARAVNILS